MDPEQMDLHEMKRMALRKHIELMTQLESIYTNYICSLLNQKAVIQTEMQRLFHNEIQRLSSPNKKGRSDYEVMIDLLNQHLFADDIDSNSNPNGMSMSNASCSTADTNTSNTSGDSPKFIKSEDIPTFNMSSNSVPNTNTNPNQQNLESQEILNFIFNSNFLNQCTPRSSASVPSVPSPMANTPNLNQKGISPMNIAMTPDHHQQNINRKSSNLSYPLDNNLVLPLPALPPLGSIPPPIDNEMKSDRRKDDLVKPNLLKLQSQSLKPLKLVKDEKNQNITAPHPSKSESTSPPKLKPPPLRFPAMEMEQKEDGNGNSSNDNELSELNEEKEGTKSVSNLNPLSTVSTLNAVSSKSSPSNPDPHPKCTKKSVEEKEESEGIIRLWRKPGTTTRRMEWYHCDQCDYKTKYRHNLPRHLESHRRNGPGWSSGMNPNNMKQQKKKKSKLESETSSTSIIESKPKSHSKSKIATTLNVQSSNSSTRFPVNPVTVVPDDSNTTRMDTDTPDDLIDGKSGDDTDIVMISKDDDKVSGDIESKSISKSRFNLKSKSTLKSTSSSSPNVVTCIPTTISSVSSVSSVSSSTSTLVAAPVSTPIRIPTLRRTSSSRRYSERIIQCPHCPRRFKDRYSLKGHIANKHTKDEDKPFVCNLCDKRFGQNCILKLHLNNIHYAEKKYQCSFCKKKFRLKSELRRHEKKTHGI